MRPAGQSTARSFEWRIHELIVTTAPEIQIVHYDKYRVYLWDVYHAYMALKLVRVELFVRSGLEDT